MRGFSFNDHPAGFLVERCRGESRHDRDPPALRQLSHLRAQRAACRQLVGVFSTKEASEICAACRPENEGAWLGFCQARQVEQRISG